MPLGRPRPRVDKTFALLFIVMLAIAAGNTALQSVLPALGRSLGASDSVVAAVFSVSALLWMLAAPYWAHRSERQGRRAMVLVGIAGFTVSQLLCGLFLAAGINGLLTPLATFLAFIGGRLIYGSFGSAAPPAVQALVAGRTSPKDRTKALTLLASAFGLGTILGPTIAPFLVFGALPAGLPHIGLSGPPFSHPRGDAAYAFFCFASAPLALSARAVKAAASRTAMSARTLRSSVFPAAFRPAMNVE